MLRILHTSDWHLGKTLERQSRQSEQEMVMEEIVEIAEEESCDLVWLPATSSTLQPRLPGQKPSL